MITAPNRKALAVISFGSVFRLGWESDEGIELLGSRDDLAASAVPPSPSYRNCSADRVQWAAERLALRLDETPEKDSIGYLWTDRASVEAALTVLRRVT